MAERSPLVSLALISAPLFCLTALRASLPALDSVLSDDILSKSIAYGCSIFLGIIMFLKYRVVEDHEYHRSKAIRKLSKSYKLDNKGLWEDSDSIIRDLELKAKSNLRGKTALKSEQLMKGSIGNINMERIEDSVSNIPGTDPEAISDQVNDGDEEKIKKLSMTSRLKRRLDKIIDNAALREIRKSKKDTKPRAYPEVNNSAIDNKWNISSPKKSTKVVTCNSCHSLNEGDTNYCGACGNYLS